MGGRNPKLIKAKHDLLIEPIREAARKCGYAVAVHGSLARDLDYLAVPWTDEAVDTEAVVQAIASAADAANKVHGGALLITENETAAARKPHGRKAWVILVFQNYQHAELGEIELVGTYIDLSVMPKRKLSNE